MTKTLLKPLELAEARQLIAENAPAKSGENVSLSQALGRVPVEELTAKVPLPNFDQSTRDGYVLPGGQGARDGKGSWYCLGGEIPAGSTETVTLAQGISYRIMTGGLVPETGERVIPQEGCLERDGKVFISDALLQQSGRFIRIKGCDVNVGGTVLTPGKPLGLEQIALLAESGHRKILVHKRPRISYFCSGSELVLYPEELVEGKKISANRYLLDGMIRRFGGEPNSLGTVVDYPEEVAKKFRSIDPEIDDVIVSTGGMGPGKFDLLEEVFQQCGGMLLYRSLKVRPGKITLCGRLGKTLYLGLPGPPPAVRTLGNELLRAALLSLQGVKRYKPATFQAHLEEPLYLKKTGMLSLIGGILTLGGGHCRARRCRKGEVPTVFIALSGNRKQYEEGSLVEIHVTDSPFFG